MDIQPKDIFLLIAGALIAVVPGYIINLTTPSLGGRIQKWRGDQAQKRAKKSIQKAKLRLEKLESKLNRITARYENPQTLIAFFSQGICISITFLTIGAILVFLIVMFNALKINDASSFFVLLGPSLMIFAALGILYDVINFAQQIKDFKPYTSMLKIQIKDLQNFLGVKKETDIQQAVQNPPQNIKPGQK